MMIRKAHYQNNLSPIQKKYLVEKVLLEHPYLDIATWMIQDIEPNEKYYNLIKQRAEKKGKLCGEQLSACYALSKFNNNDDINLLYKIFEENIKTGDCLQWIFRSIEKFPNEKFYPLLEDYFKKNIKGKLSSEKNIYDDVLYFSRAVASFKSEKALTILKYIEQNNTYINKPYWPPLNKKYVYKAMLKNYDSIYYASIKQIEKELNNEDLARLRNSRELIEYNEFPEW